GGYCTVLQHDQPIRDNIMSAVQAERAAIRKIEGLAADDALNPVQRAFIANHGVQCDFCTPGFLMLVTGVLAREPDISDDELREVLSSNLCRWSEDRDNSSAISLSHISSICGWCARLMRMRCCAASTARWRWRRRVGCRCGPRPLAPTCRRAILARPQTKRCERSGRGCWPEADW